MARLSSLLLVVFALLTGGRAEAAVVAILRPPTDAPELNEALFRLQGELLAVGLVVAVADRPPDPDTGSTEARAWFERTAVDGGIDAFIDVVGERAPVAVDVWIYERAERRLRVSRVVLDPNAPNASATLAIRAIEVLRSSFLALDMAGERPERASPPVPERASRRETERPEEPAAAPTRAGRFGISAGAATLTSFDGVGTSILPILQFDWALSSWLGLQATGAGLGTRPRVAAAAGSVQVAQDFAVLGLCACRSSATGVHPFVALGAGVLHTGLDGEATPPNVGHHVDSWAALVDASGGVTLSLPERFYLTLAAHVQVAEPYGVIHFANAVVATTGRPNLLLALTAGAWL